MRIKISQKIAEKLFFDITVHRNWQKCNHLTYCLFRPEIAHPFVKFADFDCYCSFALGLRASEKLQLSRWYIYLSDELKRGLYITPTSAKEWFILWVSIQQPDIENKVCMLRSFFVILQKKMLKNVSRSLCVNWGILAHRCRLMQRSATVVARRFSVTLQYQTFSHFV